MRTLFAALATLLLAAGGVTAAEGQYFRFTASSADIPQVSFDDVVRDLRRARIIFIGEEHSNLDHHQAQLAVIRALHESGAKLALGLEMFRADSQEYLDSWLEGTLDVGDMFALFAHDWYDYYWPLYRDIIRFAGEEKIPLVGLNLPREIIRQVGREGFDGLPEKERLSLPRIECDLDGKYRRVLSLVMEESMSKDPTFVPFCEAQVLRDAVMAQNLMEYAAANSDRIMIILAGNFHAWKHGVPSHVRRNSELPMTVILPSDDRSFFRYNLVKEDADYVWWKE